MKFKFIAEVSREVTDTVILEIEAESELHGYAIAEKVLEKFPQPHTEDGIPFCYIDARKYGDVTKMDINTRE